MVFSSIPAYLDPSNWQQGLQQPNYQTGGSASISNPQLPPQGPPQQPPPPPLQGGGGGVGMGSIRPGSMADRARMANIPMPETAQKCPRCESTNTKFCYFNNYSPVQPRHFCKTCRRYWTRGGALRNVPVGGGCRRNKRSKGSSNTGTNNTSSTSKSPASSGTAGGNNSTSSSIPSGSNATGVVANLLGLASSQIPQFRFMAPLTSQFSDHYGGGGEIGLNYGGISTPVGTTSEMNFQLGSNLLLCGGGGAGVGSYMLQQQAQAQAQAQAHHQFPFLGGLDPSSTALLYPFHGADGGGGEPSSYVGGKLVNTSMLSELASVKMEDNNNNQDQSNLSRQFLGGIPGNDQQWSTTGTAWTDLSGFSSSSTSNPL
ncbi:hypothetical protein RJ639_029328 [Escallonia herrerae]|uniref:Dof zinc finger protein n=1 Tax=Escallonia herrerae TaxID=1293975 RepID=A0AA88X828_9ASTE|nr:hypothetical protein RJ639_029328 [Escallonia herrerae]